MGGDVVASPGTTSSGGSRTSETMPHRAMTTSRATRSIRARRISAAACWAGTSRTDATAKSEPIARPTGVATLKPGRGALQDHVRRGERVQAEEACGGEERERDVHDSDVATSNRGGSGAVCRDGTEQGRAEDEPEVRRVVLPLPVQPVGEPQDGQAGQGQCEHCAADHDAAPGLVAHVGLRRRRGPRPARGWCISHGARPSRARGTGAPRTRRQSPRRPLRQPA